MQETKITFFNLNLTPIVNFYKKRVTLFNILIILIISCTIFLASFSLNGLPTQEKIFFQDDNGQTYLYGLDPFHFLQQAEEKLNNPLFEPENYHVKLITWFHKLMFLFNFSLVKSMFMYSFSLIIVTIIVCYFVMRKLTSTISAFLGSLFFISLLANSGRILPGFVDTDIYVVFLPLLVAILLFSSEIGRNSSKELSIFNIKIDDKARWAIYYIIAGFIMGLFSRIWHGWWIFFHLFWISLIMALVIKNDFSFKLKKFLLFFLFFLSSTFFVVIFSGINVFLAAFTSPIPYAYLTLFENYTGSFFIFVLFLLILIFTCFYFLFKKFLYHKCQLNFKSYLRKFLSFLYVFFIILTLIMPRLVKNSRINNTWETVLSKVVELQGLPLSKIIPILGGLFIFLMVLIGLFLFLLKTDSSNILRTLVVFFWFFISLNAAQLSNRFIVLLLVPVSFSFIWFTESLFLSIEKSKTVDNFTLKNIIVVPIILILLTFPLAGAHQKTHHLRPNLGDSWYGAADFFSDKSGAVIISWWDYGYFFRAYTNQKVFFDGGTQVSPTTFWLSKAFATDDQDKAKKIMLMLACSGDPFLRDVYSKYGSDKEVESHLDGLSNCGEKDVYLVVPSEMLKFNYLFDIGLNQSKESYFSGDCVKYSANCLDFLGKKIGVSNELKNSTFVKLFFETNNNGFKNVFQTTSPQYNLIKIFLVGVN